MKRIVIALITTALTASTAADVRIILNFSDGSTEVCDTPDPWQLDYTTFVFTGISCRPDKIFAADFEAANRRESNR